MSSVGPECLPLSYWFKKSQSQVLASPFKGSDNIVGMAAARQEFIILGQVNVESCYQRPMAKEHLLGKRRSSEYLWHLPCNGPWAAIPVSRRSVASWTKTISVHPHHVSVAGVSDHAAQKRRMEQGVILMLTKQER